MLEIIKKTNINFIGHRKAAFIVSGLLIVVGISYLAIRGGPNYGIDFTGGTLLQLHFDNPISTDEIRHTLSKIGLAKAVIQRFGAENEFIIQLKGGLSKGDTLSPLIEEIAINPNPTRGAREVLIQVSVNDSTTGDSKIKGITLYVDSLTPTKAINLAPEGKDEFDSFKEIAKTKLSITNLSPGRHSLFFVARDEAENLSATKEITLYVIRKKEKVALHKDELESRIYAPPLTGLASRIISVIKNNFPKNPPRVDREETVGPKVGSELQKKAILTVLLGMLVMLIYISLRFDFKFGAGAIIALFHDVLITLAILSFLNKEITLPIIAAFLTIVGYSINDSIVVSDRIRENKKSMRGEGIGKIINTSINQCLSRTIITSLTTIIVLTAILLFGGKVISDFAFALLIGVIVGTYSSIFILSPIVYEWEKK